MKMSNIQCEVNSDQTITIQSLPQGAVASLNGNLSFYLSMAAQTQGPCTFNFNFGEGVTFSSSSWLGGTTPGWVTISQSSTQVVLDCSAPTDTTVQTLILNTTNNMSFQIAFIPNSFITSPSSGLTVCTLNTNVIRVSALANNVWVRANLAGIGSNGGAGDSYVYNFAAGTDVSFSTGLPGVQWLAPSFIQNITQTASQLSFTSMGTGSLASANFLINTNHGVIDPTVVSNPDI